MDIAVMAYSFSRAIRAGALTMPELIRRVHALAVRQIELRDDLLSPDAAPGVRAALRDAGLAVPVYDLECDVTSPDAGERRREVDRCRDELAAIADYGARQVLVIPAVHGERAKTSAARQAFCEALSALVPEAARYGMTVTIENLGIVTGLYGRSDSILGILAAVGPGLRVTFDAGNFLLAGEDQLAAFDRLAPQVAHVHFKDWQAVPPGVPSSYPGTGGRHYEGVALGDGQVDLRGIVDRLRKRGYHGTISIEYEGPGDPTDNVRRGCEYLRSLLSPE